MSRPFPLTRVAGTVLSLLLRLYWELPLWAKFIVGIVAFVWVAKG
jgi:hypothetical protein